MIELFTNDHYKLLKLMYDNQTTVLKKKVVPLTQQEISDELGYSKMKTNAIFSALQKEEIIVQKARGKYCLSEKAVCLIEKIESAEEKK